MSNDWTNKLRDQLADYQEPVKEDLWARIEQSLAQDEPSAIIPPRDNTTKGAPTPKTLARQIFIRRFSTAAAIACLAVVGTYVYQNQENQVGKDTKHTATNQQVEQAGKNIGVGKGNLLASIGAETTNLVPTAYHGEYQGEKTKSSLIQKPKQNDVTTDSVSQPVLLENSQTVKEQVLNETTQEEKVSSMREKKSNYNALSVAEIADNTTIKHGKKKAGWSLQLYGGNAGTENSDRVGQPMVASVLPPQDDHAFNDETMLLGANLATGNTLGTKVYEDFGIGGYKEEAKHHLPISVGMQVGYGLTPRLRLHTGVVYTYVSSDFIGYAHGTKVETTQNLHYLGIPLNLNYNVWGTSKLHTYLTIGGEGDFNIKNDTKSQGVEQSSKRDKMQWSANAAIGLQYDVIPQMGIYVEPGAKYYFDNGSQIENAFKDKKLNFSLQLGFRWNISSDK